ncbi:hypothetical protein EDC04DRAFT_2719225 [Pisolithus marmoratus]|nr:hypothetical protein EDC04DRAFT_2719225 [Pisolithus marmoratus]
MSHWVTGFSRVGISTATLLSTTLQTHCISLAIPREDMFYSDEYRSCVELAISNAAGRQSTGHGVKLIIGLVPAPSSCIPL